MCRALLLVSLVLGAGIPASRAQVADPDHGDDPSPMRFAAWFAGDLFDLARGVDPPSAALGLGLTGCLALASLADAELSEEARESYTGPVAPVLDVLNELGDPRAHAGAGILFLGTLLTDDRRLQDAAFTSLQAATYAGAVTVVLKEVTGRVRPYAGGDPYEFRPFSGHHAFPSGHATLAFALVTPWVVYYPHPATYALLILATGTAVARVARANHWPSDVLAGAALGTATGYVLARRHLDAHRPTFNVALGDRGGAIISVSVSF